MPRDLFGDVSSPSVHVRGRKSYAVPLSFVLHVAIVAPIGIMTIFAPELLPIPRSAMVLVAAPAPPVPPQPPARPAAERPTPPPPDVNAAPVEAPNEITPETGIDYADPVTRGVDGGTESGIPGGTEITATAPEPPPPPAKSQEPLRLGGNIKHPIRISGAHPVYPQLAQMVRVEGTVIIEAVIAIDGRVESARLMRSIPLLDQAALDAVKQWLYTPATLNGVPVPVYMTVTVTFSLQK